MTDIVVSGLHLGLDANTITTYWLSYNRDNMVIKYGKGLRWKKQLCWSVTSRKVSQPLKTGKEKEAVVGVFSESIIRTETKILFVLDSIWHCAAQRKGFRWEGGGWIYSYGTADWKEWLSIKDVGNIPTSWWHCQYFLCTCPAPTSLSPRQLAHGTKIMDWRKTLRTEEVILPRFSPQFVNGDTRGSLNPAWSLASVHWTAEQATSMDRQADL